MPRAASASQADVVILTAIALEYEAVLKVEAGAAPGSAWRKAKRSPNGLLVSFREFLSSGGRPLRVAVARAADMGPVAATQALSALVDAYQPACVAMCGVCAGRPGKTQLGDVIIAERLSFHDTGKQLAKKVEQDLRTYNLRDDWKVALEHFDFAARFKGQKWWQERPIPYAWQENWLLAKLYEGVANPGKLPECDTACAQWKKVVPALRRSGHLKKTSKLALTAKGKKRIEELLLLHRDQFPDLSPGGKEFPFHTHVAPMASGSKVIEDRKYWGFISSSMRKTLGLEMEGAAVGALAHARSRSDRRIDALVMKGVMDFGNKGRDDQFKAFAARASAECLLAFLRENLHPEVIPGLDDLLVPGTERLPPNPPPSALLTARYQVVKFEQEARADILTELNRWSDEGPDLDVRLVHAEGGAGKTRLGIEWARQRCAAGWAAGFLVPKPGEDWFERLWAIGRPVAVVIDYAESRQGLGDVLQRALRYHQQAGTGDLRRVRFLLLARNDGDWWMSLKKSDTALGDWLGGSPAIQLKPFDKQATPREQLFRHAAQAFADAQKKPLLDRALPALTDPRLDRALYLHMAALAFVNDWELGRNTLIDIVLDHEERFWASRSQADEIKSSQQQGLARQLVAAATLRGGIATKAEASALAERLIGRPPSDDQDRLLLLLHRVYQRAGSSVFLPPLEPDLLGEAMVLRVAEPSQEEQRAPENWIERVFPPDEHGQPLTTGFTVLGRASEGGHERVRPWMERMLFGSLLQRAPLALVAAKTVGMHTAFSVLGEVLADRLEASGDASVARALEGVGVPDETVSLRRVAEWSSRTLLAALPPTGDERVLAEQARHLNNLGNRLSELGRRDDALDATRQAAGRYRTLAQRNSDAFLPDLAASLNNLGIRLSEVGRREEAEEATREAVDLRRTLAQRNPDAFRTHLATSLNNLGIHLIELGRREEALDATREAVDLYRTLAQRNPDTFLPDLAMSLNNLGNIFRELERLKEAFAATREAVDLYRALAQRNPDAFLPHLAMSLSNLGIRLSELGRREESLDASREAVDLYRALAQRNPDTFLPDLAISLDNHGSNLSELGRREEALDATCQAVDLYRALAHRNSDAFLPDLALGLSHLGFRLSALARSPEALTAVEEALNTLWPFFERLPTAFAELAKELLIHSQELHASLAKLLPPTLMERQATFKRLTHS